MCHLAWPRAAPPGLGCTPGREPSHPSPVSPLLMGPVPATSNPEEALQLPPVEADHDLPIHHDDRGGHLPGEPDHLLPRGGVLRDINAGVRDPLGRKKLFGCVAGCSGRRRVDCHARIGHGSSFPGVPRIHLFSSSGRGSPLLLPGPATHVSIARCIFSPPTIRSGSIPIIRGRLLYTDAAAGTRCPSQKPPRPPVKAPAVRPARRLPMKAAGRAQQAARA